MQLLVNEIDANDVMIIITVNLYLEPVYLCILSDAHYNSCPNILECSDVSSTAADATDSEVTHTASFSRRQSRKPVRKEDSGIHMALCVCDITQHQ